MKKAPIVGGVLLLAVLAGWGGAHVFEGIVEKSVAGVLSGLSAQAGEIRYRLFGNTLTLKGVTYELPEQGGVVRKGSVEHAELEGMDRSLLAGWTSSRRADALPLLAERIVVTGIRETRQQGRARMEQSVAEIRMQGWRQRLDVLLEEYSRNPCASSFYEELYRCRLDGLDISGVKVKLSEPGMTSPLTLELGKAGLSEGIAAPRGEEKVPPVSLYLSGLRLSGPDMFLSLPQMEMKRLLLPEPELMAEFVRLLSENLAQKKYAGAGTQGGKAASSPVEEKPNALAVRLSTYYKTHPAYSSVALKGANIAMSGFGYPFELSAEGFTRRLAMAEQGAVRSETELSRFRLSLPKEGDEMFLLLARHVPEGIFLSMSAETLKSDRAFSARWTYDVESLFRMEGEVSMQGDMDVMDGMMIAGADEEAYLALLREIRVEKLNVAYELSGIVALGVEYFARKKGMTPGQWAAGVTQEADKLSADPDRLLRELSAVIRSLLTAPGEVRLNFMPAQPMSMAAISEAFLSNPGSLPLSLSAKPGARPLADFFPPD